MAKEITNIAASIKARLTEKAKAGGESVDSVLVRFASERFLYRLGLSKYKDTFLLKGAALFSLWFNEPHRPTKDLDFLGSGASDIPTLEKIITEICQIDSKDGLQFISDTVTGERIREEEAYQGVRVEFKGLLDRARISLRVDVGFGDAVTPQSEVVVFPTILDLPAPKIGVYPKETVVAEKFEAMVRFGIANSRMKDFWDVQFLISEFDFEGRILQKAIKATFESRKTPYPKVTPVALTDGFAANAQIISFWKGFISRNQIIKFDQLDQVTRNLRNFISPIIDAENSRAEFSKKWNPSVGWK